MKEVIVIFATVILGVAIAAFVVNLDDTAESITDGITTNVENMITDPKAGIN